MTLLLIFFFIIITLLFFIYFSSINIEILNLVLDTSSKKKLKNFLIVIRLKLFNKLSWIKVKIDKDKIGNNKLYRRMKQKLINKIIKDSSSIDKEVVKDIIKTNMKIEKFQLDSKVGVEDVIITSFLIAISSSLVAFLLANMIDNPNDNTYYYRIEPVYEQENILKVYLNCIFSIKIMNLVKFVNKKS